MQRIPSKSKTTASVSGATASAKKEAKSEQVTVEPKPSSQEDSRSALYQQRESQRPKDKKDGRKKDATSSRTSGVLAKKAGRPRRKVGAKTVGVHAKARQLVERFSLGKKTAVALFQSLQRNPKCAKELEVVLGHDNFSSQGEIVQMQLLTAASAGKGKKAGTLLSSDAFQNLSTMKKQQAGHMLLTSRSFKPAQLEQSFAALTKLKGEFNRLDPNNAIYRATLADKAARTFKAHPEVFQLLGVKERYVVMQTMLGQLGIDGDKVNSAVQRDVLQAVKTLKADNPNVNDIIPKTLELIRGTRSWDSVRNAQTAATLGQMLFDVVGKAPGFAAKTVGFLASMGYSTGMGAVLGSGSGPAGAIGGAMEGASAVAIAEWLGAATKVGGLGGWAVTIGVIAFEGFKGYMADKANELEAKQAEKLLREAGLMRCAVPQG